VTLQILPTCGRAARRVDREHATVIERDDEFEHWPPAEADPISIAVCPLITAVFEMTAPDSPERKAAVTELLQSVERLRRVIVPLPKLH
jgi:hypothetical protein